MKKRISTILCILLVISLLVNAVFLYLYFAKGVTINAIIGTYYTGTQQDAEYLVFQDDGKCFQYRQFEPATQGMWAVDGDDSYLFMLTAPDGEISYFILNEECCYLIDGNKAFQYTKLSSTPSFINTTISGTE